MQIRGNCFGHINDCKIKLQNASTAGFCVEGAINRIRALSSSHYQNSQTQSIMSEQTNASAPIQSNSQQVSSTTGPTGLTYAWQPVQTTTAPNNIQTISQPSKQEAEPESDNKPGQQKGEVPPQQGPPNKEEPKEAPVSGLPTTVEELQKMVLTQQEVFKDLQKRFATLEKDNSTRKQNEQRYYAASKVARYSSQFKS